LLAPRKRSQIKMLRKLLGLQKKKKRAISCYTVAVSVAPDFLSFGLVGATVANIIVDPI
jgi:hypothetical protein